MLREPMLSSLMRCGEAHRRFKNMGLRVPTGTTIVEQGFSALSFAMFERPTRWLSLPTFRRHAMLAVLLLNFSVLRGHEMDFLASGDKRVLMLLEAAWQRLHAAVGLSVAKSGAAAEQLFRDTVSSQEQAADALPADEKETQPVLPFAAEGFSGSD